VAQVLRSITLGESFPADDGSFLQLLTSINPDEAWDLASSIDQNRLLSGRQQDIDSFLTTLVLPLLDHGHYGEVPLLRFNATDPEPVRVVIREELKEHLEEYTTSISHLHRLSCFLLLETRTCLTCGKVAELSSPQWIWKHNLGPFGDNTTLLKIQQREEKPSTCPPETKCSGCTQKQLDEPIVRQPEITRKYNVVAWPPVLWVSLGRSDLENRKLATRVVIPYTWNPMGATDCAEYSLRAIVVHKGVQADSGHFVAVVFDHPGRRLFVCDDDDIKYVNRIPRHLRKEWEREVVLMVFMRTR
jgi:hypothetical protein